MLTLGKFDEEYMETLPILIDIFYKSKIISKWKEETFKNYDINNEKKKKTQMHL